MPCPDKLGPFLAPGGARCRQLSLVGAYATLTVTKWRTCRETRHITPNDAKQRRPAPPNVKKRQETTTRDEKRQEASHVESLIPAMVSRSRRSRKWSVSRSRNFSRGKTDNRSEAITLARIIFETDSSNTDTSSRVGASDRRFTLPEIAKAARRWLAPEPLAKLLHELRREEESEPTRAPARATDRERDRAYERLRSLGKLHR